MTSSRRPSTGAALLVAMVILTLVSTLAAGMIWQQWRAVQVEAAERARAQAAWILTGALDFGRVILRLDARKPGADHLGEPWAMKMEESSLSGLLAQDRNNSIEGAPEAFLLGGIRDAQSRYNLRNLLSADFKIVEAELATLKRLCESAAVGPETAERIAIGLLAALQPVGGEVKGQSPTDEAPLAAADATLLPQQMSQLVWLGLDMDTVNRLRPYVDLLPQPTPLNLNTSSAAVLAGVVPGLDASGAERIVQHVQRNHFKTLAEARTFIQEEAALDAKRLGVSSRYFEISGRLRMEGRVLEERLLIVRDERRIVPLVRSRQVLDPDGS